MVRLLYQFPTWMQRLYPGVRWRVHTREKVVYLSFDDGPIPEVTPRLLDILDREGVKATFFWVGENVYRYPELAREVVSRGHQVGNHTFNHLPGMKSRHKLYVDNVALSDEIMQKTLGPQWTPSGLFRPPYGRLKWSQKHSIERHHTIVLWDIITHDYNPHYTPEKIVRIVDRYVRPGSIITFHDSLKSQHNMLESLPVVIQMLKAKGYRFALISS